MRTVIAIVVSRADRASEHIGQQLLELAEWEEHEDADRPDADGGGTFYRREGFELRTFDDLHIYLGDPTPAFGEPDAGADGNIASDAADADGDIAGDDHSGVAGVADVAGDDHGDVAGDADVAGDGTDAVDDDVDMLVFVSRHSGETGPLLTAHFTGNFGPAEYGGSDGELARAAPNAQKRLVDGFEAHAPERYDVGIECTHHGPSETAVPSLFAELGSGDPQWDDVEGARAVAQAVLDLEGESPDIVGDDGRTRHVVGFGGGHYVPRFTRIVEETAWGVGHIGADWQLADMGAPEANRDVLERAFDASAAEYAVVEGEKPALEATVEDLGYRVVGETWVNEVGERPLALVETVEDAVATVGDGLRFGEVVPAFETAGAAKAEGRATERDAERSAACETFIVGALPDSLLASAQGIDPEAVRETVGATTVAFETEQAGSRAAGRAAFPDAAAWETLVEELASTLREKYDEVVVADEAVVAREEAFDPALAAKWGVPEGPKFGRLAAGESVELERKTVDPADVRQEREERFPLSRPTNGRE